MLRTPLNLALLSAAVLGLLSACADPAIRAQVPIERPDAAAAADTGLVLTCEVFCSATKLRTSNARILWRSAPRGPEAAVAGKAQLQTTVFYQGFEKDMYVTLPTSGATPAAAVAARPQVQQRPVRAFDIRVIELIAPRRLEGGSEVGVVVENLEPGMNYTWRVVMETASGQVRSQEVTCQAPVCPADIVDEAPRRPGPGLNR